MADHSQASCYVPDPKYTFLFAPDSHERQLTCAICNDSKLILPSSQSSSNHRHPKSRRTADDDDDDDNDVDDTQPALLPCGHVFGRACLNTWLATSTTTTDPDADGDAANKTNAPRCPVCRFRLGYELCAHAIPPRPLTLENVLFVPATLPLGGAVAAQCAACAAATDVRVAAELCRPLAARYYELRAAWARTGSARDRAAMEDARAKWEAVVAAMNRDRGGAGGAAVGVGGLRKEW